MNKKSLVSLMMAVLFGLVVAGFATAGEGPEVITLKAKKGDVTFHHHQHQERAPCAECHHGPGHSEYKAGMKIQTCDKCHNKEFSNKKLNSVMKAMHTNCKGCHKEKGGPTKCGACHKK